MSSTLPKVGNHPLPSDEKVSGNSSYGLEPLILPMPSTASMVFDPEPPTSGLFPIFENAYRRLVLMSELRNALIKKGDLSPVEPATRLFRFRWITGHQVSFILWYMLACLLDEDKRGRDDSGRSLQTMVHYVRGYCGMLLYTGSCSRDIYHNEIRPSMFLHHPAFSGSWSIDFIPVRDLFRGRIPTWGDNLHEAELRRAIKLSQLIHNGVAAKLVPNGRSLLQQSGFSCRSTLEDRRQLGAIYDNYFLTQRSPVLFREIFAQLLDRLDAILQDVAVNGLNPFGSKSCEEEPSELLSAEVIALHDDFFPMTYRLARFAARFLDIPLAEPIESGCGATHR